MPDKNGTVTNTSITSKLTAKEAKQWFLDNHKLSVSPYTAFRMYKEKPDSGTGLKATRNEFNGKLMFDVEDLERYATSYRKLSANAYKDIAQTILKIYVPSLEPPQTVVDYVMPFRAIIYHFNPRRVLNAKQNSLLTGLDKRQVFEKLAIWWWECNDLSGNTKGSEQDVIQFANLVYDELYVRVCGSDDVRFYRKRGYWVFEISKVVKKLVGNSKEWVLKLVG